MRKYNGSGQDIWIHEKWQMVRDVAIPRTNKEWLLFVILLRQNYVFSRNNNIDVYKRQIYTYHYLLEFCLPNSYEF